MKVCIEELNEEVFDFFTIKHSNSQYDYDIPNDLLKKWINAFSEFQKAQQEIAEYFEVKDFKFNCCNILPESLELNNNEFNFGFHNGYKGEEYNPTSLSYIEGYKSGELANTRNNTK